MARQRAWQEKPEPPLEVMDLDVQRVLEIFEKVRAEGRLKMGDSEARAILEAYSIPVPASKLCARQTRRLLSPTRSATPWS